MVNHVSALRVAVIGAGIAGAACAASLQRSGVRVSVFDKSRGSGGRMATRRLTYADPSGQAVAVEFDHGAPFFTAQHPRFRALARRALSVGCVARWQPRVYADWPAPPLQDGYVGAPTMSALCRHVLAGVTLHLEQTVRRLQRNAEGWQVVVDGGATLGPFDHVMVALPAPQAALLLAGHRDEWADQLAGRLARACWTLMAVTPDMDWPWDAAQFARGPLDWVIRNDRKPGRQAPPGQATWVAHASAAWSAQHLEDDPRAVTQDLRAALAAVLPPGQDPRNWPCTAVHRWRHAVPVAMPDDGAECWWDPALGLGVCGDVAGGGTVESAWRSGDELADTVLAWAEEATF